MVRRVYVREDGCGDGFLLRRRVVEYTLVGVGVVLVCVSASLLTVTRRLSSRVGRGRRGGGSCEERIQFIIDFTQGSDEVDENSICILMPNAREIGHACAYEAGHGR